VSNGTDKLSESRIGNACVGLPLCENASLAWRERTVKLRDNSASLDGAALLLLSCTLALRERTSDGRPHRSPVIE
jgi:hypothetical protein